MRKIFGAKRDGAQRFWMVPGSCVAAAAVLAQVVVALDRVLPDDLTSPWITWIYAVGVDGARAVLTSVGGSMLGVAATAFSITIAVIATTSSTYGPRLVRNFMTDRANQFVLGVLVSTFVYALLVLRTIRSAVDPANAFVPHLAVNLALVLAVADVAVVVYFIQHIAASVQVDTLVRGARRNFRTVAERWREEGETAAAVAVTQQPFVGGGEITAGRTGYVARVDFEQLCALADEEDVVLELVPRIGDHVLPSEVLARLRPAERADGMADAVRRCVLITDSRSPEQDVLFAEQQLVEMAVRALSPGTNDPYTAINAIEEVAVGIVVAVSARESRADDAQQDIVRVYFRPVGLQEIVDMPFDQIRPCALEQVPVLQALIDLAFRIETAGEQPETATQVREHVRVLLEQFRDADPHPRDLHRVERHIAARRGEVDRRPVTG